MNTVTRKLVTIVCDPALQSPLLEEIKELGAAGHRVIEVQGEGGWEVGVNAGKAGTRPYLKIETIVTREVGERILAHVSQNYLNRYSAMVYLSDVEVLRPDRFLVSFRRKLG